MSPVLAIILVIVAAALSVLLITKLYASEEHRTMRPWTMVLVALWFLITYGVMAFAVIPR